MCQHAQFRDGPCSFQWRIPSNTLLPGSTGAEHIKTLLNRQPLWPVVSTLLSDMSNWAQNRHFGRRQSKIDCIIVGLRTAATRRWSQKRPKHISNQACFAGGFGFSGSAIAEPGAPARCPNGAASPAHHPRRWNRGHGYPALVRRVFRLSQASASRHSPTIGKSAILTAFQPMASSSLPDVSDAVATVAKTQKSLTACTLLLLTWTITFSHHGGSTDIAKVPADAEQNQADSKVGEADAGQPGDARHAQQVPCRLPAPAQRQTV